MVEGWLSPHWDRVLQSIELADKHKMIMFNSNTETMNQKSPPLDIPMSHDQMESDASPLKVFLGIGMRYSAFESLA
jgi:hypothetical protein